MESDPCRRWRTLTARDRRNRRNSSYNRTDTIQCIYRSATYAAPRSSNNAFRQIAFDHIEWVANCTSMTRGMRLSRD
eukprot:scaffold918_cov126-Cylindrotheca_fusiformis.AAC.75